MVFQKIYSQTLDKLILPCGDLLEGGSFTNWLNRYRREQWLSAEKLEQLQTERLAKMLNYARQKVPFYANLPKVLGNPYQDLRQFPILTKTKINDNIDALLTAPKENLIPSSGSGSSGVQGTVYLDKSAQASQRAMQLLWFEWSGYRLGDSILQTGMTLNRGFIKGAKDRLLRTQYIPAFTLDEKSLKAVLEDLVKNPRSYLFGYASSLFVLAETALSLGIAEIKFKHAVSWGDKLFPHYRRKIKEAFGCETLDTYGCTEGAMVAAQCPAGSYHLSVNQCYMEIVDDDGQPVPKGEMGKVVATRLDNFAMPLIRYYLGDLAELEAEKETHCLCGRQSPLLRRVIGRDTEIVKTQSGKQMIVHFFTAIFEHIPQIRQFKVVQKNLSGIEIHYIRSSDFHAEILKEIEIKIARHLQENLTIQWVETSQIEPTKSGKPQIIQSLLTQLLTQ
jgi:phenylacetate-CoA ligase